MVLEESITPNEEVMILLGDLNDNKHSHLNKLKNTVAEQVICGVNFQSELRAIEELFNINVNMVEVGEGTVYYLMLE
ncbi:hypothetical protein [Pontibacter qinzhouensis]|uniref:hypothetical protein n=1 Tax=Pontibacter qinzhouensis TaxID=2603253 RepID=UPI00165090EC|nr:hypothetical protein [Pontibacter qinzhouensis]